MRYGHVKCHQDHMTVFIFYIYEIKLNAIYYNPNKLKWIMILQYIYIYMDLDPLDFLGYSINKFP